MKDTHYTVTYQKNQDKGTATIIFTGLESGGYTGTKKTTFKITASGIGDKKDGENPVEQIQVAYKDVEKVQDGIYVAPYMKGGGKGIIPAAAYQGHTVSFGRVMTSARRRYRSITRNTQASRL